ncbi:MAG TPA: ferrous iron transport protein B [Epulopiscium sp.]|nr:ferrous iron transport protein B [Candidatus Epulonipiscium sp.]
MSCFALAGNPNSGKTSLFNILAKTRQHVGNWPGVTVEKKEGTVKHKEQTHTVVDLPGTYSLGAYSEDEIVARNFILQDNPDVVINVLDATNIERNLYLTVQMMEMGANMILALNMMDEAGSRGIKINAPKLSKKMGIPIVETIATKSQGIEELMDTAVAATGKSSAPTILDYGPDINKEIESLKKILSPYSEKLDYPLHWVAIKLLENDSYIVELVKEKLSPSIIDEAQKSIDIIVDKVGFEPEMGIVDKRYNYISEVLKGCLERPSEDVVTTSDKIDRIVTHKFLGLPIFALIMLTLYQITFIVGAGLQEIMEGWFEAFGEFASGMLENMGASELLSAFVSDALVSGVGAVVTFLPLIMVMYFLIGLLEDSGYMARAAYVMDKIMRALGLHGKTFVSMILGSGCNVPAIMSTRTLDSKKDRMIAILINPFVSCGAKIPVYALFIAAFFSSYQGLILFGLYALGIAIALLSGMIFSKVLFKGEVSYFVMELPPYRIPSVKNVSLLMWEKASSFLTRAGKVIFPMVIVLWVLSIFPLGVEKNSAESLLGMIGSVIAPLFKPAGFGTWQAGVSLVTGVVAKEAVISTMGMVYAGVEEGTVLLATIKNVFTPLTAISFMVMTLLYTPCLTTLATIKKETGSTKWMLFSASYTFAIAYVAAVAVFQIGTLLGFS